MSQHSESSQMTPVQSVQTPFEWHGSERIFVFLMFCFSVHVRQIQQVLQYVIQIQMEYK